MRRPAYAFVRTFDPAPQQDLRVDRHYLLCASSGVLRLTAEGRSWTLPPARAALIEAGRPIQVTIPQSLTSSSVLFATDFVPPPPASLTVFDLNALARALVAECGQWGDDGAPLDDYALAMFRALAAAAWALAERPSPAVMPMGESPEVRRALALTEERLAADVALTDVAAEIGLTTRSLARRFETELGMTWRAALRRLRIIRSIELLAETDDSITRVAVDVGYSSLSAFNAAFRDLMGATPTKYRSSFDPSIT